MNAEALPAVGPVWWAWMVRPAITGLLLVGLAAILERTALSRTPAGRSWMWRIVFLHLALLLVFPVPFAVGGWLVGEIRVERAVPRGTPVDAMTDWPGSDPRERSTEAGLSSPVGMSESGGTVLPLLAAAVWCAGVFRGAIRLLRTHRTARRWVRDSGEISSGLAVAGEVGVGPRKRRRVPLRIIRHPALASPLVVGFFRPVILVPARLAREWSAPEWEAVLAHEVAHIERGDLGWAALRNVVGVALFFHPLVRWAIGRAALADEMACDARAVAGPPLSPGEYGRLLIRVAEAGTGAAGEVGSASGVGLGATARRLEERLRLVLGRARRMGRGERWGWGLIAATVLGLGLLSLERSGRIRQYDRRYPVVGFLVSRGTSHGLSVTRDACHWMGVAMSDSRQAGTGEALPPAGVGPSWPRRWADLLTRLGFHPKYEVSSYSVQFAEAEPGCAILVRFGAAAGVPGVDAITAVLVDPAGESVPLAARGVGRGAPDEFLRAWVLGSSPWSPARFDLRLRWRDSGREIARIRLGDIGQRAPPAGGSDP